MNDPIVEFFLRHRNSSFASDLRVSIFMLILPPVCAVYIDTHFFNIYVLLPVYLILSYVSIILQRNIFRLKFTKCKVTLYCLYTAYCFMALPIVVKSGFDFDGGVQRVIGYVFVVLAVGLNVVGVNSAYDSEYTENEE